MTAVTGLVGSFPPALGFEKGGETPRPLAIAFVGGLAVATVLTLLVAPMDRLGRPAVARVA